MSFQLPRRLRALTPHVHVWLPDGHDTWGMANCVVVTGADTALLVDTPYTADMTRHLQRLAAGVLAPDTRIDTVVNTHGNGDHSYGNAVFRPEAGHGGGAGRGGEAGDGGAAAGITGLGEPPVEIISTEANGIHLCAEPSPAELAGLIATADPATPLGAYVLRHFGRYGDFGVTAAVPPTRTFSGQLDLDIGGVAVSLIEVGPAHTAGDLIVHLPDEGIVCAGDVIFCDDHPVHWAGPIEEIHRATLRVLECDPRLIVPGHGPVMTPADVRVYADYLLELRDRIHGAHDAGQPLDDIAAELVATDTRPHWGLTERMAILASIEYRSLDGDDTPPDLLRLVDFAAGFITPATPKNPASPAAPDAPESPATPATPAAVPPPAAPAGAPTATALPPVS